MRKTYRLSIILFCAAILIIAFFWLRSCMKDDHIELGADTAIDSTPTQIQSIKAIGEWEFLSVSVEELADTVRKGILSNDELARIYYGTLRLGINTHQMEPGWLEADGDTVRLTLPKIGLLDQDFIDEARTKSFYESGRWQAKDREALYKKAYRQMLKRCLTPANLKTAQENAEAQFRKMMLSMGYKNVQISFE